MTTKGTANHVYFTDDVLGVGSSATVYVGRNKKSGQLCAVKVYSDFNYDQKREFQTMQMLSHENIIKFISIETESISKGKVLVMELSSGGSVHSMLENPEFSFGFPEDELLVFLKDTTSALKYLRVNKIVHRDIKPGNILRFAKDDMSSQFKITDFGAARELEDDDQYVSIYGTEEYLEPMVYKQALLSNRKPSEGFNAMVDLWSLGVTLYHVATGQLPFRPFGGRKNKEEMFSITSKKRSGVISGVQRVMDGPIEWSEDLPTTCLLSRALKTRLKEMLSKLLETDLRRRWSFDDFFKHSIDTTSRRVVHVVVVGDFEVTRFYAGSSDLARLSDFDKFLKQEANIFTPSAVEYFHPFLGMEEVLEGVVGRSFSFSPSKPHLFMYPRSLDDHKWREIPTNLPIQIPCEGGSSLMSMCLDNIFVTKSLSFVFFLERKAEELLVVVDNLETFFHASWNNFSNHVSKLELISNLQNTRPLLRFDAWKSKNYSDRNVKTATSNNQNYSSPFVLNEGMPLVDVNMEGSNPANGDDFKTLDLMFMKRQAKCRMGWINMSEIKKFKKISEELTEISQKFKNQAEMEKKDPSKLTHNEIQIHKFDRKRIIKLIETTERLYKSIVHSVIAFYSHFASWYRSFVDTSSKHLASKDDSSHVVTRSSLRSRSLTLTGRGLLDDFSIEELKDEVLVQLDSMNTKNEIFMDLNSRYSEQNFNFRKLFKNLNF